MTKDMKPAHIIEAALFSAGRPLSVEEIADETDLPRKDVLKHVKALQKVYAERDTALEIGPAGTKWGMQVRTQAAERAARFAPMEIPKKVLKTLALIAYHQPLKQSELVDMIGSKTYDHVAELRERGLVLARRDGATKSLTTTAAFPEYFGLEAGDTEGVRAAMAKLVGLPPPAKKQKEKGLDGFADPAADPEPDEPGPATDADDPDVEGRTETAPTGGGEGAGTGQDPSDGEKTAQEPSSSADDTEATEAPQTA